MKVYRIVDCTGGGLYNGDGNLWRQATLEGSYGGPEASDNRPHFARDGISWLTFDSCMIFGFSSKAQLKAWVNRKKWRDNMSRLGGKVVQFEVPKEAVIRGGHQVAFIRAYARQIAVLDIATI